MGSPCSAKVNFRIQSCRTNSRLSDKEERVLQMRILIVLMQN